MVETSSWASGGILVLYVLPCDLARHCSSSNGPWDHAGAGTASMTKTSISAR